MVLSFIKFGGKFDGFDARFMAAGNSDGGFSDFEMFGKYFNQCGVGFAVVGFGTKIDNKLAGNSISRWGNLDDFILRTAGFNGD